MKGHRKTMGDGAQTVQYRVIDEAAWAEVAPPPPQRPRGQRRPGPIDLLFEDVMDLVETGAIVRLEYGPPGNRRWVMCTVSQRARKRGLRLQRRESPGVLAYRLGEEKT